MELEGHPLGQQKVAGIPRAGSFLHQSNLRVSWPGGPQMLPPVPAA